MSYFGNRKFLFEADDDGAADASAVPTQDTSENTAGDNTPADDAGQDTEAENNDNNDNADDDGINIDDTQDDDFSIDAGGDDNEDEGQGGEDSSSSDNNDNSDDQPKVDEDSLRAKDKEFYDSLEPAEQEMKLKNLKQQFIELYTTFENVIDKFNGLAMEYDDMSHQIKGTIDLLFVTKKMIADYLLHVFDSKSVIENDIMYTRYLTVLNSVKNITNDMKKAYKDDNLSS